MEDTTTAVADAPSSTPAPAATPSASPSSEPTITTDRPSFGEALKVFDEQARQQGRKPRRTAAPAADPSTATPDATAVTEGAEGQQVAPPVAQGPIPLQVHQKALENARVKTEAQTEQRIRQQFGLGNSEPQGVSEVMRWAQFAKDDPASFIEHVIQDGLADPRLAPRIMSVAGRMLGGQRQAPAQTQTEEPQPDFQDERGNRFYSATAQQKREQWLRDQIKADLMGELQPLQEQVGTVTQREQIRETQAALGRWSATTLSEVRALPYFTEHEKDIKAAYAAMPPTSGHPAEEVLALQRAYHQVVGPKRSQLEQARVVADLNRRANASTLNPGATGAPSGIPKTVRAKDGGSMGEALKWAAAQQSGR